VAACVAGNPHTAGILVPGRTSARPRGGIGRGLDGYHQTIGAQAESRTLSSEKARLIVEAMRASVARHGTARATFDHVAREAGVSRGLLHYYFGTKERLLVEVVRHDAEVRMARLEEQLAATRNADDFIKLLAVSLREGLREDPEFTTLVFELFTQARRHPEIATEFAQLLHGVRELLAAVIAAKQQEGVLRADRDPGAVAEVLLALGDGMAMRMLSDPDRDFTPTIDAAVGAVRVLLVVTD
jgi:AcrR family transcriptional regulator